MDNIISEYLLYRTTLGHSNTQFLNPSKHFTLHSILSIEDRRSRYLGSSFIKEGDNNFITHLDKPDKIELFLNTNECRILNQTGYLLTRLKDIDKRLFLLNYFARTNYSYGWLVGNGSLVNLVNNKYHFKAVLCIKQEYIYYFKLWLLVGGELDFDIFYILTDENFLRTEYTRGGYLKNTYNKCFTTLNKNYSIPITIVPNLNAEILKCVEKPAFKTIRDYNSWLNDIKIKSLSNLVLE